MDEYTSFEELARHEVEGVDYVVITREGVSSVAIIAPHGGAIEPGTADIADSVASDRHAFAAFKGIKKRGNAALHIPSDRFDEPAAVRIAEGAQVVVTIHGCQGANETVFVGGRNHAIKRRLIHALRGAGFHAEESLTPGLEGKSPDNICNRCRTGQGVQIEVSRGLRERLFEGLSSQTKKKRTPLFRRFVDTVREAIEEA